MTERAPTSARPNVETIGNDAAAVFAAGEHGHARNAPSTWSIAAPVTSTPTATPDLLWRNPSGNNAMWFMNGTTVASMGDVGNIPTSWRVQIDQCQLRSASGRVDSRTARRLGACGQRCVSIPAHRTGRGQPFELTKMPITFAAGTNSCSKPSRFVTTEV